MFIRDVRLDSFVEDLLTVEDLPKNEVARLFLAARDDQKDGGNRREALLKYYHFLSTKKGNAKLLRLKNRSDHEITIQNASGHGSITLKPNKCITGIIDGNTFHMVEGFSTVQPRTLTLPDNFSAMFECTLLNSISWALH